MFTCFARLPEACEGSSQAEFAAMLIALKALRPGSLLRPPPALYNASRVAIFTDSQEVIATLASPAPKLSDSVKARLVEVS